MALDYQKVAELLALQQILNVPAEVQGMVCGQLGSGQSPYRAALTCQLLGGDEGSDVLQELLNGLAQAARAQFDENDFGFELLLPDDDEALPLRLYALGRWCDGFNLGFAAGLSQQQANIPAQVREVLADFARIAEVDSDEAEDDDAAEADYMQLVEYVRVASQTLYLQQREPVDSKPPSQDSLH